VSVDIEIGQCGNARKPHIVVTFSYSARDVDAVKSVGGRTYCAEKRHWHAPLDMQACRELRRAFKDRLSIGPELRSWAQGKARLEQQLGSLALADSAELQRLQSVMPSLYAAVHLGPLGRHMTPDERIAALAGPASYQAADVAFLANSAAPLNGNDQGTGKTLEWIGAVWEAGIEEGCHLIICPKAAVDGTWEGELIRWQAEAGDDVEVFACVDNRDDREATLRRFAESTARVKWVVVNPAMLMWVKDPTRQSKRTVAITSARAQMDACYCKASKGAHEHYVEPYPILYSTTWTTLCIDEAHKGMVRNRQSLTAKSINKLNKVKACAMTGTPMKKQGGADLWGILHYLNPTVFSSYWRFVNDYFEVRENYAGYKEVGGLLESRKDDFWKLLQPYMLRRLKSEVAPWLPPKLYVIDNVSMTARQAKQYREMEAADAVEMDGGSVSSTSVLATMTRLKQFANAYCKVDANGDIVPVESNKVEHMLQRMEDAGVFDDPTKKQLVFSQSRRMVEFIARTLKGKGINVEVISGKVNKSSERQRIISGFQTGDIQVLVIVTTAGGVSLTLDAADDVHLIDEMWAPDEDMQAEDRAHRVSRIHQVTVYIYRSSGTIDSDIAEVKEEKAISHAEIMDVRRKVLARAGK
jgi:SNF2 family DNA or RNA helicase